jgi:hypothetical protein
MFVFTIHRKWLKNTKWKMFRKCSENCKTWIENNNKQNYPEPVSGIPAGFLNLLTGDNKISYTLIVDFIHRQTSCFFARKIMRCQRMKHVGLGLRRNLWQLCEEILLCLGCLRLSGTTSWTNSANNSLFVPVVFHLAPCSLRLEMFFSQNNCFICSTTVLYQL